MPMQRTVQQQDARTGRQTAGQRKPTSTRKKDSTSRARPDDRPWRSPPRSGRKSPSRRKAVSPGRRKSPRRKKASAGGSTTGGSAPAPHMAITYRDVAAGVPATSAGGLISHQALPNSGGLTRAETVRRSAANGPDDQAVDPAAHAATIADHSEKLCASLMEEHSTALQEYRAAVVAEMALIESILQDRRRELQGIDAMLSGIRPATPRTPRTPRRRKSSGASKARKSSTSPSSSKTPKR